MSVLTPESLKSIAITVKWEQTQLTTKLEVYVLPVNYACCYIHELSYKLEP